VSLSSRLAASPRKRRCFALMHTVKPATSALCCTSKRKFLAGHVTRSLVSPQPTSHRYMYSQWQCKVARRCPDVATPYTDPHVWTEALMHTVKPATSALCRTSKRKFLAGHVTRSLVSPQPTSHRYMYSQWQCKVATDALLMLLHHMQILMSGLRLDQPQLTLSCSLVGHSNGSTNL
jgi:hypothetical protein